MIELLNAQPHRSSSDSNSPFSIINDPIYGAFRETATLRSIVCITQDRLVAVGDRGTILLTEDAGHTWRLVASPTTVNLAEAFYDGQTVWAVGGWIGNGTGCSYAVLVKSVDGGLTWQLQPTGSLPRLTGIHVHGARINCWGDYCPKLRCSVFTSVDGGLSWHAASKGIAHVTSVGHSSTGKFLAVDLMGRAVDSKKQTQLLTTPDRQIKTLIATNIGWLAGGERGLLIGSPDGLDWSDIQLPVPNQVGSLCDWQTAQAMGNRIWLAGSPGSIVFQSEDNGRSWKGYPTGQNLPINKLCFIDPQRGWAVGAQGTLLATRDGGRSWYPQRQQPTRVSLLNVNRSPQSIPWPALVSTVWDHNRCAACVALRHAEPLTNADTIPSPEVRSTQFARQMGLSECAVCEFSSDGSDAVEIGLAMQIAIWRPDVLLANLNENEPLSECTLPRSVNAAMARAGAESFATMVAPLYLKPWQPQKLVEVVESGRGDYSEHVQKVLRGSGLAISDILWLLPESERQRRHPTTMQTVWSKSQSRALQSELLGGTIQNADTRIPVNSQFLGSYQSIMGRVHRDRMLTQLFRSDESEVTLNDWKREFLFFVQTISPRDRTEIWCNLVQSLIQRRQYLRAHLVLEWALHHETDVDAARFAGLQTLLLCSSQTCYNFNKRVTRNESPDFRNRLVQSHRRTGTPFDLTENYGVSTADFRPHDHEVRAAASPFIDESLAGDLVSSKYPSPDGSPNEHGVVTASAQRLAENEEEVHHPATDEGLDIHSKAMTDRALIDRVLKLRPELRFEPRVIMLLASIQRRIGNELAVQSLLNEVQEQPEIVAWHQAAHQELAVLTKRDGGWKWRAQAAYATLPPQLDGQLSEEIWSTGNQIQLDTLEKSSDELTAVRWAYDNDYLYVGIISPRSDLTGASSLNVPQVVKQRDYDADLSNLDQVELTLDPLRDYNSMFHFSVAENGLTRDRFMNVDGYNPKWHVQVISLPDGWQAEIAIPLIELGISEVNRGDYWAVSARRIGNNRIPQSWTQLRTHLRMPQANGLLKFD